MGASYPDLNRCIYMFTDDRRCKNLIWSPGMPHCKYHRDKLAKKPRQPRANAASAYAAPQPHAAYDAFMNWLAQHPLDTVTNITRALNQIFILVVAGRLSAHESSTLLRNARLALSAVKGVRDEFGNRYMTPHAGAGMEFLAGLRETLLPAIESDLATERTAASQSAAFVSTDNASASAADSRVVDDPFTAAPLDHEDELNPPYLYTPLPPMPEPPLEAAPPVSAPTDSSEPSPPAEDVALTFRSAPAPEPQSAPSPQSPPPAASPLLSPAPAPAQHPTNGHRPSNATLKLSSKHRDLLPLIARALREHTRRNRRPDSS